MIRTFLVAFLLYFSMVLSIHAQQITPKNKFVQPTASPFVKKQLLQKKLAVFTDRVKAERVLRINTLLSQINQTQTSYFLDDLATLSNLTKQLQTLVKTQTNEKNTTNLNTDIKTALDTIENTKQLVLLQQKKDLTVTISSQKSAKADIQKTADLLYNDLYTLQQNVTNAKHTVTQALDSTTLVLDETND